MSSLRILKSSFFKNVGLVFFAKQLFLLTSFLSITCLTRLMGANEYGNFVYIQTFLNIASIPSKLGLDTAAIKLVSQFKINHESRLLFGFIRKSQQIIVLSSIVIGTISVIAFFLLIKNINPPIKIAILGISVLTLNNLRFLYSGILNGLKCFFSSNILQSIQAISLILILLTLNFLFQKKIGVEQALFTQALSLFMVAIIGYFLVQKNSCDDSEFSTYPHKLNEWLGISLPMMMMSSMLIISNKVDIMMVGFLLDTSDVGIYEISTRLSVLITFALSVTSSIVAPSFSEAYSQGNKVVLKRTLQKSSLIVIPTSCLAFLLMTILSKPILLLFGPEFISGQITLVILCTAQLCNALAGPVGYLLTMTGHQKVSLIWLAISLIINVSINLILIPKYGIEGAAIATMIATLAWNVGLSFSVYKFIGISIL